MPPGKEIGYGLTFKGPDLGVAWLGKKAERPFAVPIIPGCCLAMRRDVFESIGGFDEGYRLVFSDVEGNLIPPNNLSRDWRRFVMARKLPRVSFHGLRHTHVSALIAARVDILTISRRIGHANAATTLRVYGHLFEQNDSAAVDAIQAALSN